MRRRILPLALLAFLPCAAALAGGGNRLTYLDSDDPYYVGRGFPKLTTPQWVGESGVEAVVVLAIDDLRDNIPKYEAMLRPILDRLERIDGRAPVSIMTCKVDPQAPEVQRWLREGVNLDVHTLTHPCPLLQKGDFAEAARTYHGGVDLLNRVPENHPVAFRMPCCDSLNTPSPRFFAEIFNRTSPEGHFLSIDSSVFNITTPADPDLPRELVFDPDGRERFRKYLPFPSFVNTIEDYPYPYVINRVCWEFPCVVPSDWEAQHLQEPFNPKTVEDLKAAIDAVVIKQGVFNLVFHPHGWIKSEQVVELIDHAVRKHGKKVKFLNFREALDRLEQYALGGHSLRSADGRDNGVRLIDLNEDGYMDVVLANERAQARRIWDPKTRHWVDHDLPSSLRLARGDGPAQDSGFRFGIGYPGGIKEPIAFRRDERGEEAWMFGSGLVSKPGGGFSSGLELDGEPLLTCQGGVDRGVRFRDLDGDGRSELIVANVSQNAAFLREDRSWRLLPFALPEGARIVDAEGRDAGLRFVDLDEDGHEDVVFSNDEGFGVYLFDSMETGWSRKVTAGKADDPGALPKIVSKGMERGFWAHSRHLWWQNEDTAALPDLVDRRAFNDLLKDVEPRAKSPAASLKSIRVRPGFAVELVASEPMVEDPIAFDWGADGSLWVVEMEDYPRGVDGQGKPGGIVRNLKDTDGDGTYETSTVFLDDLPFPTGIMPWRKGVLIACAPDILYAEDRDGDGKADVRDVLFTGFVEGNQQHRLNGFDLGLDGWVYGANGDSGGKVRSLKTGEVVDIRGRDFRFRPDDGRFETESGQAQYGRHRDDWGDWFGTNNPSLGWHYVLAERDLRRNPRMAVLSPKHPYDPDRKLYPVSRTLARFNDFTHVNMVTSANSPTPYRDDLFGPEFARSVFVSEPVHNLVRRVVLEPDGVTFSGRRAVGEEDREFLASSDNWFRPTMMRTGPDGALWIADMYRFVIEHPEWIPDDWEASHDLRLGHDMGRIYRVYPVDRRPRPIPRLDRLDTAGLVAAMDSPNGWRRDTAQRLLLHANDSSAVEPLRRLVAGSPIPKARLQALWTLAGLGGLTREVMLGALGDEHPEVRRGALRAGQAMFGEAPELGEAVVRAAEDSDPRVRFQAALSVGGWADPRVGRVLAEVLRRAPNDSWTRAAVLASAPGHAGAVLAALFAGITPPPAEAVEPLFALAASEGEAGLAPLMKAVAAPAAEGRYAGWQFAAVAGLLDAARRPEGAGIRTALAGLHDAFDAARQVADDDAAPEDVRLLAARLLGREPGGAPGADRERLARLLRPQVPPRLQQEAVAALGRVPDPKVPAAVLAGWKGYGPALRSAVLDALLGRDAWAAALLSSLEEDCVPAAEIDTPHRRRLLQHPDEIIRERAAALFDEASGPRQEVVDRFRPALATAGDPEAGAAVFKRICASCHRLGAVGVEVGPDLAALTDKDPESLLVAILDPNRAFEAKYTDFTVQMADGRVLNGLIAEETATGVSLRRQEGKDDVLLRADIDAMAGSGRSLMPEGLEKEFTGRDLADLIAYLSAAGPPRKQVEGNRPERVRPGPDGTIVLKASQAEIYGDGLTFEPAHGNLGYWTSPNDQAVWNFDTGRAGRYEVWFEWACADGSAGNAYQVRVGPERLEGTVAGTGSWDDYRRAQVGEVTLPAGAGRLEIRPARRIRGALIDLRAVELRPIGAEAAAPGCCEEGG